VKLEFRVLPWQAEAYQAKDDVIAAIGGVGSGKSIWGADSCVEDACRWPKAHHFYIGAAKPSMRDGTTQTLLDRLEEWKILYSWSRSTLDVTLRSGPGKGAQIVALSAETYQRWKGLLVDRAWCDEAQAWLDGSDIAGGMAFDFLLTRMRPSEAAQRHYPTLMPRIRITANPPHRTSHWLYQKFVKGSAGRLFHPTVFENTLLPMPLDLYVDRLKSSMSEDLYQIEVLGQWGDLGVGRTYTSFVQQRNVIQL
jgi:hypothetical protein